MATSKAQDPAAAALSAIEEALNLGENGSAEAPEGPEISTPIFPKASDLDKTPKIAKRSPLGDAEGNEVKLPQSGTEPEHATLRLPEVEEHPLFAPMKPERNKIADTAKTADFSAERGPVTPSVPPANDDRDSVGAMLRALNRKPSRAPFVLASLFSGLWIAIAAIYLIVHRADFFGHGTLTTRPDIALFALAVAGPVTFFFVTAVLARRAQEMRLTAGSLVEIAMRLAEPESIASEQMVTLSQAIRREIVSMGDGIERALARAGELETLVRSEVSNLERSYADNERRVRTLVEELSTEREAMQANSERMRSAIGGAQDSLSHEIEAASTGLAENLGAAGNRITMSLDTKAEEIRFALGQVGDQLIESLTAQAEDVLGRLERTKESVSQGLAQQLGEIGAQSDRTNERLTLAAQELA